MAFDWATYCTSQVLAMGGYWLIEPIRMLAEKGHCFDRRLPEAYWQDLQSWMKRTGHWNARFLGEKGPEYTFALDFVQTDISPEFLYKQYQACQAGVDDGYCLGSDCLGCGACIDAEQRRTITRHQIRRPERGPYLAQLKHTVIDKRKLKPVYLRLYMRLAGGMPEFIEAVVFKELLDRYPEWIDNLLSVRESVFTTQANKAFFPPVTMGGEHIFALKAWDTKAIQQALTMPDRTSSHVFKILGWAAPFTPGTYTQLDLDICLPADHLAEPRKRLETYLRSTYLPYSLQRQDGGYVVNVAKKGRKKKVLYGGRIESSPDDFVANLNVGPKFDVMAFFKLFDRPNAYHYAKIVVSRIWIDQAPVGQSP